MIITRKIKSSVTHQGIGGKIFEIEKEIPKEQIILGAIEGNWSCYNFMERRKDFNVFFTKKLYYGHEQESNLGYILAEDELE